METKQVCTRCHTDITGKVRFCSKCVETLPSGSDARLIAAAPMLLEACLRAKPYLASLPGKYAIEAKELLIQLKAAIAAAQNEQ